MGEEGFGPSNALRGLIYSQLPLTTRPFALHPFVKQALLLSSENQKGYVAPGAERVCARSGSGRSTDRRARSEDKPRGRGLGRRNIDLSDLKLEIQFPVLIRRPEIRNDVVKQITEFRF